jgi:hypothetical protein
MTKPTTDSVVQALRAAGVRNGAAEKAAAVALKAQKTRGYSRAFPQRSERRIKIDIDRVPPTLDAKLRAKCARLGVSLRHLTLTLWTKWIEDETA